MIKILGTGRLTTSTATGQMQFWGPTQTNKSLSGFGKLLGVSLTMFHFANDGVAYENHSTIMQVQQADLMRAWATTPCSFIFQNCQKNP